MTNPNRIHELRTRNGLSLDALGKLAGTSGQQISKLELGKARLTVDWMLKLAPHLGVDPKELMDAPAEGIQQPRFPTTPQYVPNPKDVIPVRSGGRGGHDQQMFMQDGPIDWVRRPGNLFGVSDAYAIYMVGDSMSPRYEQGWTLHVHPHKPPAIGRDVVITKRDHSVLVKTFRGRRNGDLLFSQINPPKDFVCPLRDIGDFHLIVGVDQEG